MSFLDRIGGSENRDVPHLWLAAIALGSILTQGYLDIGSFNQGVQIGLIRYLAGDPAFQSDPVVQAFAGTYATFFFPAIAWLTHYISLPTIFFGLFLICRLATAWLAYTLAVAVWGDRLTGLLTSILLTIYTPVFAVDAISFPATDHALLAQVLVLGSLTLCAQGRIIPGVAVIGLTFNIHALHAIHALGIVSGAIVLGRGRKDWRGLALGIAAALVCMSPTVVWMLHANHPLGEAPADYVELIRSWFPLHFWPSSWGAADWASFLFPALAAWPIWRLASPTLDNGLIPRIALLSLIAGAVAGIATELHPEPLILRAHPMRVSWLMGLAGLPLLARASVSLLRYRDADVTPMRRVAVVLGSLLLLGIVLVPMIRYVYWLALVPALWMFVITRRRGLTFLTAGWIGVPLMAALGGGYLAVSFAVVRSYVDPSAPDLTNVSYFLLLMAGVFIILAISATARAWLIPNRPVAPRALAAFRWTAACLGGLSVLISLLLITYPQISGSYRQWYDVQRWLARNAPMSAKVIVPFNSSGIRAYSNQIPVLDVQEGDLLVHNPEYASVYRNKLNAFGWKYDRANGLLGIAWRAREFDRSLTPERAIQLGDRFGAKLAVRASCQPEWPFTELYRNPGYVVYRLPVGSAAHP